MRNRVPAFFLAFVSMLFVSVGALAADDYYSGVGVFADSGIMPLASVSGYTVDAFVASGGSSGNANFQVYSSISPGNASVYVSSFTDRIFGYRVTIPASSSSGILSVVGLFPVVSNLTSPSLSWSNINPSSSPYVYRRSVSYVLSSDSTVLTSIITNPANFSAVSDISVFVPAHSQVLYLYVYSLYDQSTLIGLGAYYSRNALISFTPDRDYSSSLSSINSSLSSINSNVSSRATESTLKQVLTALQNLASSVGQLSPMEQFENNYLDNFSGQLDKAENAISPSNPALPNGGDIGGFVFDVSSGLGLSGSSFNSSDFSSAASGFTGSDSTSVGGPWEFFTQVVADDLSGDSPMSIDLDYDPILAWLARSDGRFSVWVSSSP